MFPDGIARSRRDVGVARSALSGAHLVGPLWHALVVVLCTKRCAVACFDRESCPVLLAVTALGASSERSICPPQKVTTLASTIRVHPGETIGSMSNVSGLSAGQDGH